MSMTDSEFHQKADEMFHIIENAIEDAIDSQGADVDVDASHGALQLEFDDGSVIVINKQEPLHEIWMATRFGGFHFACIDGDWIDQRNGGLEFMSFVRESIKRQSGINVSW
ncbi:iron donor protein CyaY [Shewanella cyperi]|uniref:Iron-sulfur cluster assembly protein CyaY n=1 Tax=Shewanella cyperi TaxID=2814292 RepID=A0A974XJX7_9GAMM|nr:iron donor protein CyaY [Shewanella cyperi]QSX29764.1 iron donor protein CyaY [Shewanella cyperi]QSX40546.1 iron donor protein CyaY [Shewanella cyperi]